MTVHQKTRLIGMGAVFVASVALTAIGILFDLFVPKGSVVGLLLAVLPLGCAVLAVLAGFHQMLEMPVRSLGHAPKRATKLEKSLIGSTNQNYPAAQVNGASGFRTNSIVAVEQAQIGA
ncbi:MAG TPA: hypothetical protein VMJ32_14945 [Pirellulales bacterium]|nr:hypothetical protein [Pirellulales bacterium]